jgi:actin-related protein
LTENSVHNKDSRLKLTEFLFEKLELPALFICKDSVLISFACGRSTALVLDSGFKTSTATPVHDGYALQKCIVRHQIGGDNLTQMLNNYLNQVHNVEIKPRYSFKRKVKV